MNSIESNICDAIELLIDHAISQASFDRTIQATVIRCVDPSIGKYLIRYQDSTFYAYSNNIAITYGDNTGVYILIPSNDMNKDKSIIGAVEKVSAAYIEQTDEEDLYNIVGSNCAYPLGYTLQMSSYYSQINPIYLAGSDDNLLNIDITALNNYLKDSSTLICGAYFKTKLAPAQQIKGNYGITFGLDFKDNAAGEIVTRYYTVDTNKMRGNPYKLLKDTRQFGIFEIDGANFVQISSISLFVEGFPKQKKIEEILPSDWDIGISAVEIYGADALSQDDLTGYKIFLQTPEGAYFENADEPSATKAVTAQLRANGKIINLDTQNVSFYWFIENLSVTVNSEYYNKYGGYGWKCLNDSNIISENVREWVAGDSTYSVSKKILTAKENKIKCVAVANDMSISNIVTLYNFDTNIPKLSIISDQGTEFYYDAGNPTLTCLINGVNFEDSEDYSYLWAVEDNTGTISKIDSSKNNITINVNEITNFSIYKCSVFDTDDNNIGTTSITLTNLLKSEGVYTLTIDNGSQFFTYDENGVSPASVTVNNPITILPLKLILHSNQGQAIDSNALAESKIEWRFPLTNSLIVEPDKTIYTNYFEDFKNNVIIYYDYPTIEYKIANQYSYEKTNNIIQANMTYKDIKVFAQTALIFNKQGDPGTNGTDYTCRIIPNTNDDTGSIPIVLTYNEGTDEATFNYKDLIISKDSNVKPFKAELWENGNKIFTNVNSGFASNGEPVTLGWSVLKNKYSSTVQDTSPFNIQTDFNGLTGTEYLFNFDTSLALMDFEAEAPANLIKATLTYKGQLYYAVIPVITIKKFNSDYEIEIVENTGFSYVTYTSSGKQPKYTNRSFEVKVFKDGEDISSELEYNWEKRGNIKDIAGLIIPTNELNKTPAVDLDINAAPNKQSYYPTDTYNGLCVNNAVYLSIKNNDEIIANINIPIHYLLNRYGLANINEWDGNSIQINENGGFILSPQVGAGYKDENNRFTGILIGEVKEASRQSSDIGLLGYHEGIRTIHLDSETGAAILGAGSGQLAIDPSNNSALLYSHNYWKDYNEKGFPKNYENSNVNTEGMLIDLTTPGIRFGSKNFTIDDKGNITAKSGTIGGWQITEKGIETDNGILSSEGDTSFTRMQLANFDVESKAESAPITTVTSARQNVSYSDTINNIAGGTAASSQSYTIDGSYQTATLNDKSVSGIGLHILNNSQGLEILSSDESSVELNPVKVENDESIAIDGYLSNWNLVNSKYIEAESIYQGTEKVATEKWVSDRLSEINSALNKLIALYEQHGHVLSISGTTLTLNNKPANGNSNISLPTQ